MNFLSQIMKSSKKLPRQMLRIIKCDVRSNTGGNLRHILLESEKVSVDHLSAADVRHAEYHPVKEEDEWRARMVKELLAVRFQNLDIEGFDNTEIVELLNHLCSS